MDCRSIVLATRQEHYLHSSPTQMSSVECGVRNDGALEIPRSALPVHTSLDRRDISPRRAEPDFINTASAERKEPDRISNLNVQVVFHRAHARFAFARNGIQEEREA